MIEVLDDLRGKRILLAVSGGIDSVVLLDFFSEKKVEYGILELAIVHIDHGLRGKSSEEDATFVENLAKKYKLPFYFQKLSFRVGEERNIESRARAARYDSMLSIKRRAHFDLLATAHHEKDQQETILMRLSRGTSLSGIRGIKKFREDGVYRPFLEVPKEKINAYAAKKNLPFREDETNLDTKLRRNFVRHIWIKKNPELIPPKNFSFLAHNAYEKIIRIAEETFFPTLIPKEKWPFREEFSPYKNTLAFDFTLLSNALTPLRAGGEEIFRLWLASKNFQVGPGKERTLIFPLPNRKREIKNLIIEKSRNRLWFFDKSSLCPNANFYFSGAPDDSLENFSLKGEESFSNKIGSRRKLNKKLQEKGIPHSVRNFLPLSLQTSKVLCPPFFPDSEKKLD